jgi:heterodisulfide reductase subunit C
MAVAYSAPLRLARDSSVADQLRSTCDIDVDRCYECGKCSGGCSSLSLFDYTPRQVVQLAKLGDEHTLLHMAALSACVGCGLCTDRCPAEIDVAALLDHFRQKAHATGVPQARQRVELLNTLFLDGVRARGRTSELHLMARFNLKSRQYFKDKDMGMKLLLKGKLRLLAPKIRDVESVRALVDRGRARKRG